MKFKGCRVARSLECDNFKGVCAFDLVDGANPQNAQVLCCRPSPWLGLWQYAIGSQVKCGAKRKLALAK